MLSKIFGQMTMYEDNVRCGTQGHHQEQLTVLNIMGGGWLDPQNPLLPFPSPTSPAGRHLKTAASFYFLGVHFL